MNKGQLGFAPHHSIVMGDEIMAKKRKSYSLRFVNVGTEEDSASIIRSLAKNEIEKVLAKHGALSYNLDEVLSKYITGDMCYDEKG